MDDRQVMAMNPDLLRKLLRWLVPSSHKSHNRAVSKIRHRHFSRPRAERIKKPSKRLSDRAGRQTLAMVSNLTITFKRHTNLTLALARCQHLFDFGSKKSSHDRPVARTICPPQQLDANRSHFRDYVDGAGRAASFDDYEAGEDASYRSRASLYLPSQAKIEGVDELQTISQALRKAQSNGSIGSSRVTSWTDSTVQGSINTRDTPYEQKRLSVIQEHGGPTQPSSSIGRHIGGLACLPSTTFDYC